MRILLANDDGINSTGFSVLERIARELSDDVWVCAPETEQSAASHSLTIHRPLRLRKIEEKRFAVDGTPTDCVLLAVNHVMKDRRPDLVLSGVNHGRNIAEDVTYSGTIAAAMEATLLGIRAIAFSQQFADGRRPDWETAARWGAEVARKAIATDWPEQVLVNVNFPAVDPDAVTGIAVVPHGLRKIGDVLEERLDPRGRTYFWIGTSRTEEALQGEETDVSALRDGRITVTPLHLDLNHAAAIQSLRRTFVG
ncbi:5'/3'-nucleotidase SurE [Inquilinus limosus]|uniref:5'/3'-nucleotidase SurE n=1 Tax=Inquilinus limosus TaxID=171674 RepID=UPI0003F90418|nr:5'/3'-nucleotidase SurE [Inquilinus limosus]